MTEIKIRTFWSADRIASELTLIADRRIPGFDFRALPAAPAQAIPLLAKALKAAGFTIRKVR